MSGNLTEFFGGEGFDPTSVPKNLITPGDYPFLIEKAELKKTSLTSESQGKGVYIEIVNQVIDGEFKGMKIWKRINIINPNIKCQSIGQSQLAQLAECVGEKIVDTGQLVNKVVVGEVIVKSNFNEIKKYKKTSSQPQYTQQPQQPQQPQQTQQQQVNQNTQPSGRPPWAK